MTTTERIKKLIYENGKSDYAIKKETGLGNSVLSDLKAGRAENPSVKTIKILAEYFNVSADYLLCLSDSPAPLKIEKTKNAIPVNRPEHSLALSNYKENCETLANDEHFVNTTQLYAHIEMALRSLLYGELVRWLENHNVNVAEILGL